jgi:hypothetical protein
MRVIRTRLNQLVKHNCARDHNVWDPSPTLQVPYDHIADCHLCSLFLQDTAILLPGVSKLSPFS